ncbi:cytochrome ubiquinol oxidase subunit I, partial [Listeria monocytogenes]|nr:cytochrome ubiquinol oxidase subunit I [Listeria monocytogenes]
MKWNEFIVTGDPMILGAHISIVLVSIGVVALLTYTKKWKGLMKEWISSVDHKKIGIMYLLAAGLMFFRGGVDALMMRT